MGRQLKRVPLDFNWELGKVWSGYINPHPIHDCNHCEGQGWSLEYKKLQDEWYGWANENWKPNPFREDRRYNAASWNNNLSQDDVDALIQADRLWDFTRVPLNDEQREVVAKKIADGGNSWLPYNNGYKPTAQEVNEWNLKGMGHDSLNCSIVIQARLEREGKSHLCQHCNGEGTAWQHPKAQELWESWEGYEPPVGEGYQLWENTSEGSPKSPVFETLDELCEWCETGATTFGKMRATAEEWKQMLSSDTVHAKMGNAILI